MKIFWDFSETIHGIDLFSEFLHANIPFKFLTRCEHPILLGEFLRVQVYLLHSFQAIEPVSSCQLVHLGEDKFLDFSALADLLVASANFALFLLFNPSFNDIIVGYDNGDQVGLK